MPSRENCSTSAAPTPPDWTTRPVRPGEGRCTANVAPSPIPAPRRRRRPGPASRMPAPPGGLQQAGFLRRGQARGNHRQRSDAAPAALAAPPPRRAPPAPPPPPGRGPRAARRPTGRTGCRSMSPPRGLTAYKAPAKPASRMLSRIVRPIDPARLADADHRDRPGCQQGFQAGDIRVLLPAGHRVQVGAGLAEGRVGRDRHGQLDHAVAEPAPHGQPRVGEHPQHRVVVRQHLSRPGPSRRGPGPARPGARAAAWRCRAGACRRRPPGRSPRPPHRRSAR